MTQQCSVCSSTTTKACNVCKRARFCSPECQRKVWFTHKTVCGKDPDVLTQVPFDHAKVQFLKREFAYKPEKGDQLMREFKQWSAETGRDLNSYHTSFAEAREGLSNAVCISISNLEEVQKRGSEEEIHGALSDLRFRIINARENEFWGGGFLTAAKTFLKPYYCIAFLEAVYLHPLGVICHHDGCSTSDYRRYTNNFLRQALVFYTVSASRCIDPSCPNLHYTKESMVSPLANLAMERLLAIYKAEKDEPHGWALEKMLRSHVTLFGYSHFSYDMSEELRAFKQEGIERAVAN